MRYKFKELIEEVQEKNESLKYGLDDTIGVTIEKGLIPTVANLSQTALDKFYVIRKHTFIYNPRTHGVRIGMGYNKTDNVYITSWNNVAFKIKESAKNIVNPDYLWIYFCRSEWDRETNYYALGSSTIVFLWSIFLEIEIELPTKEIQDSIVEKYQIITNRIDLKRKINDNLEAQAQAIFEEQFASMYLSGDLPKGWRKQYLDSICTVKGGKRLPSDSELLDYPTDHPYIRVRDVGTSRYVCLTDQFQYIDEETHQAISRYIVNTDDIVISIVGTIGLIGKIHSTLNKANLTENCVKLTNVVDITPDYLYYTLCMKKNNKEIDLLTVGAVQAKLPMYNIQSIEIVIPPEDVISSFQSRMDVFNSQIEANTLEIQRLVELSNVLLAKLSG